MDKQEIIQDSSGDAVLNVSAGPRKKKKMNDMERSGLVFAIIVLVPVFISFLVFWVGVNASSIALAFTAKDVETGKEIFSFEYFGRLFRSFKDPESALMGALGNTMKYFIIHLIKLLLSVTVAYFLYKKVPGHIVYKILFYLPAMIPSIVYIAIFKELLGKYGLIYTIVDTIFSYQLPEFFAQPETATNAILFYVLWSGFGTSMLIFVGSMNRIPGEVIDAANLDGVGMAREFVQIVLPLIWETFGTYFILAFTGIFMETGPLLYFIGEPQDDTLKCQTINYWMFLQVRGDEYNYPSAIGLFFGILTVPFVVLCRWMVTKIETVTY